MKRLKTIGISFTEGRVIRDFFENGLVEKLHNQDINIVFFTPAERVPHFKKEWEQKGVKIYPLFPYTPTGTELKKEQIRNKLLRSAKRLLPYWMKKYHVGFTTNQTYKEWLQTEKIDLMVITNPLYRDETMIWSSAKSLGIPTIGIMRSWDNLYQGIKIFTDKLVVWNEVNKQEAIQLIGFPSEQIMTIGACQFDGYFDKAYQLNKEDLCTQIGFDPNKPIITIATIGELWGGWDENGNIDQLLELNQQYFKNELQFIIRLHPGSKYERLMHYGALPNVFLSHIRQQIPTLGWYMDKKEVGFLGSILKHSDVVISPGSTITIETAIFDTPTLFPTYNYYQPEFGKQCYEIILPRHHKRLRELDLVPFIEKPEDLLPALQKALTNKSWYAKQRQQLFNDYIVYNDGKSTDRLVAFITNEIAKI